MDTPQRRAIFLDRDGVINRPPTSGLYITSPDDLKLIDGVAEAIHDFRRAGFLVIIVTNQSCIARGLLGHEILNRIHGRLRSQLQAAQADVDDLFYCPHDDDDECSCRKPKPGMLIMAAERYGIDLAESWMVGDAARDIEAGRAVGCMTVLITPQHQVESCFANLQLGSLLELRNHLFNGLHPRS